jgi:hypothetical protein
MTFPTPSPVTATSHTDDIDVQHIVCCDLDTALCGEDVSNVDFTDLPCEYDCPLCLWADEDEPFCSSPTCPGYDS